MRPGLNPALPGDSLIIGYCLLVIGYSDSEKLRWILSWQPDVQVLEPARLRERIREKLAQALEGYETGNSG